LVDLLKPQKIEVYTEGTLVVLKVGNSELKMPYELAIQVSTWMRVRGKEAKRAAGDDNRHWSVVGSLETIIHDGRPW
jgi:hypothetical protein